MPALSVLRARLAALRERMCPVLVVRLPELERIAWRRGRRAARATERTATAAFSTAVARVLRAGDAVAHEPRSDAFVAALTAPVREGGEPFAVDARSALARIGAAMESATRLHVVTGWTTFDAANGDGPIDALIERALANGEQERQRYGFFSSLGHELRTPLASIRGYLETLLDARVDDETRRRFVRIAHGESLRLSRLVDGMFEISLLDMSAGGTPRGAGSVPGAIRAAMDACAAAATERGVRIATEELSDVTAAIDVDRLTLVLVNLIGNAIKHGRTRGEVLVATAVAHDMVRITVDDDGPGIAPDDRERVFAMGVRGSSAAEGSGIGLAIARMLVERAGGRVHAERSPLGGARFAVTLPGG